MNVLARQRIFRIICLVLPLSCCSRMALADEMTVGDLQPICSGSGEANQNACRFYILGVVDGADLAAGRLKTVNGPYCMAEGVRDADLVDSVKKWMQADLKAYPADKSLAAGGFVAAAAMKSFPCPKSK